MNTLPTQVHKKIIGSLPSENVRSYRSTGRLARNDTQSLANALAKTAFIDQIFRNIVSNFLDLKMLVHIGLYGNSLRICLGKTRYVKIDFRSGWDKVHVRDHWVRLPTAGNGELSNEPPLKYLKLMIGDIIEKLANYERLGTNAQQRQIYDEIYPIMKKYLAFVRSTEAYLNTLTNAALKGMAFAEVGAPRFPKSRVINFVRRAFPWRADDFEDE